jgi:CheY-like chemotaxis protein
VTPGPYILLTVTDTGIGMDEETRRLIFEPFFTTKGKGKGTGLGLSTVYGIVRQNQGWIWVDSEPGKGSTFKIYLPRMAGRPAAGEAAEAAPIMVKGNETVLVVEDQDDVRRLATAVLRSQGYRVLEAAHGNAALVLAERQSEPIHLVLSDVVLPGMNGRELAERLRVLHPDIKVLYTSGYTEDVIAHRGGAGLWLSLNTVHLRILIWFLTSIRLMCDRFLGRRGYPLILRLSPRGLQRDRLETTRSSRTSFSTAS